MKVLVIQHKMIGDVLTTSLLFELLRAEYPEAQLDFLINQNCEAVIQGNPFIDKLWIYTPEMDAQASLKKDFYKTVKDQQYDLVIDVYAKLRSAFVTRNLRPKNSVSYAKWYTQFAYKNTVMPRTNTRANEGLAIVNRVLLLETLGIGVTTIPKPKIYLSEAELAKAKSLLEKQGLDKKQPLFMIGVLGSSVEKTYPLPLLAQVLDNLVQVTQANLLLNYIPSQKTSIKELISYCKETTKNKIHSEIYGANLREFLSLTAHCDALIGNEGGAVNMAKALNIPTFAIFSPWILKSAWNSYESNGVNQSIHLSDIRPELYKKHPKKYKKEALSRYQQLLPEQVNAALDKFLTTHEFKV